MPNPNNLTSAIGKAEEQRRQQLAERRRRLEERARQDAAAANAAASPVIPVSAPTEVTTTQVTETQVVASSQPIELPQPGPMSPEVSTTQVNITPVTTTQVKRTSATETPVDRPSGRYTRLDNRILDDYLPRLDPAEQLVYLRLYRLTFGFSGRQACVVSHEKLAEKTHLSLSTIKRVCTRLEANGVISSRAVLGGKRHERGSEFQLLEPTWLTETQAKETQVTETQVRETRALATQATVAHMKDSEKNHGNAPVADAPASVYEIRTIAARLFEAHRGEPGFDHERLRDFVRDALIGQGRRLDGDAIEEAIRGMAV